MCVNVGMFLDPVIESTHATCAGAGLSVIPTKAECQQAAIKLSSGSLKVTDVEVKVFPEWLPYCGKMLWERDYIFDNFGVKESHGIYLCNSEPTYVCVCKKGALDPIPRYTPRISLLGALSGRCTAHHHQ